VLILTKIVKVPLPRLLVVKAPLKRLHGLILILEETRGSLKPIEATTICLIIGPSHMLVSKLRSGTSKTKAGPSGLV